MNVTTENNNNKAFTSATIMNKEELIVSSPLQKGVVDRNVSDNLIDIIEPSAAEQDSKINTEGRYTRSGKLFGSLSGYIFILIILNRLVCIFPFLKTKQSIANHIILNVWCLVSSLVKNIGFVAVNYNQTLAKYFRM